jgi:branched-chain amino acid transport system permease protein
VSDFSRIYFGSSLPGLHLIIFGMVLILVMIFQPRGLQEPLLKAYNKLLDRILPQAPRGKTGHEYS